MRPGREFGLQLFLLAGCFLAHAMYCVFVFYKQFSSQLSLFEIDDLSVPIIEVLTVILILLLKKVVRSPQILPSYEDKLTPQQLESTNEIIDFFTEQKPISRTSYLIAKFSFWIIAGLIVCCFLLSNGGYGYIITDPLMKIYGYERSGIRVVHGRRCDIYYFTYRKTP